MTSRVIVYYNAETGELEPGIYSFSNAAAIALNCKAGFRVLDVAPDQLADFDPRQWRVNLETVELVAVKRVPTAPDPSHESARVQGQIIALESRQARALREFLLGNTEEGRARLQAIEDQITELRRSL